jgi:hypothetical protein
MWGRPCRAPSCRCVSPCEAYGGGEEDDRYEEPEEQPDECEAAGGPPPLTPWELDELVALAELLEGQLCDECNEWISASGCPCGAELGECAA